MMRTVLVVGISEKMGGVEKAVLGIIKHCAEFRFEFLCFGSETEDRKQMLKGQKVYYVTANRKNPFLSRYEQIDFWKKHGNRYDAIWINTGSASNISMHKFAKKYTKAVIVTHSHSSKIEHNNSLLKCMHYLRHYIHQGTMNSLTDVFFTCSKEAATHLFGKNQVAIRINNGIEMKDYKYDQERREVQRKRLSLTNEKVIIMLGRLEDVKNPIYGIKIAEKLINNGQEVKLLFLGDGSLREKLRDEVEMRNLTEHVIFAGFQNNVADFLLASDCLVLPSLFEGFPVSVVEAQASNLPCIVSENVTKEVGITPLVSYFMSDEKNLDKWCQKIIQIDIEKRGEKCFIEELLPFDLKYSGEQFSNLVESKINENRL